jgi:hypothetical protein
MPVVRRRRAGALHVMLEDYEAEVLRNLVSEMTALLEAKLAPGDPVGDRLFPDAFEDEAEATKYRELVGDELRAYKLHNLRLISSKLGSDGEADLELAPEEVERWLSLLTDMRLAIGTRLDVTEEKMEEDVDPNGPDGAAMSVLHWLGWLQEASLKQVG